MTEMSDRRSVGRTKIGRGEGSGVDPCAVYDVTNSGARIGLQGPKVIPPEFALSFDNFRSVRMCRLAWRQGDFLGAAFES
jgi:hypothetical protein